MNQIPLEKIASVSAGQSAPNERAFSETGIPFVRAGSLEDLINGKDEKHLEHVGEAAAKKNKLKLYPKGALLFAKSGMSATKDRIYILKNPAFVVSHLAIVIPNDPLITEYVRLYLQYRPPSRLIKDPAYPSIGLTDINKLEIPFPEQDIDAIRIAHLLGKVERLIAERRKDIEQLDQLQKSIFLEMFGDPVRNKKKWERPPLTNFGKVITGNTPPRVDPKNFAPGIIEWIKTDNISESSLYITRASEELSKIGLAVGRTVTPGAVLVACIAGSLESIGRVALTNRTVAFNQQINAIQPNNTVNPLFLYSLLRISKKYIQSHAAKGMKKILTKGDIEKITFIKPPIDSQNKFASIAEQIEVVRSGYKFALSNLETLFCALSQKAFKGELDLTRVTIDAKVKIESPIEIKSEIPYPTLLATRENSPDTKAFSRQDVEDALANLKGPQPIRSLLTKLEEKATIDLQAYQDIRAIIYQMVAEKKLSQTFDETKMETVQLADGNSESFVPMRLALR